MKKSLVCILIIALICFIVLSGETKVSALDTGLSHLTPYAGINFNTFDIDANRWDVELDYDLDDRAESGIGFFLGVNHRFTEDEFEGFGLGAEIDSLGTINLADEDLEASISTMGFLATGSYDFSELLNELPINLYFNAAAGIYQANFNIQDDLGDVINETYRGPGFKAGLQATYPVYQNINLGGRANYRYSQPHSEGELNYNGFELGAQLNITF